MHLKQFGEILNRVYIRFEDGQYPLPTNKDFSILLKSLAKFHPYADGVHLYEKDSLTGQEHIYLKRTKRFLLKKTAQYILGISQRQADESMASFVSLRQIRHIYNFLAGDSLALPAYTVIIFYVLFCLFPPNSIERTACKNYLNLISEAVHEYVLYYPDDELAYFFEDCYGLVSNAMEEGNSGMTIKEFPGIPREHPEEDLIK